MNPTLFISSGCVKILSQALFDCVNLPRIVEAVIGKSFSYVHAFLDKIFLTMNADPNHSGPDPVPAFEINWLRPKNPEAGRQLTCQITFI